MTAIARGSEPKSIPARADWTVPCEYDTSGAAIPFELDSGDLEWNAPGLIGGSWTHLVTETSSANSEESPYLAFVVALHVATAIALLIFYRRDWRRIIGGN